MAVWTGRCRRTCIEAAALGLLLLLAACGGGVRTAQTGGHVSNYTPPGPPEDPWGPYIQEAAQRFRVPDRWIREVMRQESGGQEYLNGQLITSDAGAAGLMQIMPATYEDLRERYNLGGDPYDPHDNIIAGTGYIAEMYAAYGSPGFLAAYNAGPHRVDDFLAGHGSLPNETINYLASVAPRLGNDRPMSGPLAAYGGTGGAVELASAEAVPRAYARPPRPGCWQDPDAAYDPDAPCRAPPVREANGLVEAGGFAPVPAASITATPAVAMQPVYPQAPRPNCWHDPNAAYDPDAPCQTPPAPAQATAQAPYRPAPLPATASTWGQSRAQSIQRAPNFARTPVVPRASMVQRVAARGGWAVQIGAFADPDQARRMAESARSLAPAQLGGALAVLGRTAPFGDRVLYRARLSGLNWESALAACSKLNAQRQSCVAVPPGH